MERDLIVAEVLAVEVDGALRPEGAENGQSLLPDGALLAVVEPQRLELAAHSLLGIAHAGAQDGTTAGDHVQGRPRERQIEGIARRRYQTAGPQPHARGALRDGREERKRLVARFGEQT